MNAGICDSPPAAKGSEEGNSCLDSVGFDECSIRGIYPKDRSDRVSGTVCEHDAELRWVCVIS